MEELLSPHEIQQVGPHARKWAAEQILHLWKREKDNSYPEALWGDEVEYVLVDLDPVQSRATLLLDQDRVQQQWEDEGMAAKEKMGETLPREHEAMILQREWASYMIESTPSRPYNDEIPSLLSVEKSMKRRRKWIKSRLGPSQYPLTVTVFPRLRVQGRFTTPHYAPSPNDLLSRMLPRQICATDPRYHHVAERISARRERPIYTLLPIFPDRNTSRPFQDDPFLSESGVTQNHSVEIQPDHVYLEGIGFGGGCCSLHTTFQSPSERDARWLHDQLVVLGPVMLALTAATPIHKGYLVNMDSRWHCLTACSDDRTPEEVAQFTASHHLCCTDPLTCWCSNRVYLSYERPPDIKNACSQVMIDETVRQQLLDGGMDETLAFYFSHLLWRDPIYLTRNDLHQIDPEATHLFQRFRSGVWQHVHLKTPQTHLKAGWRVEFRPMEVQFRDYENAAFAVFMCLLARAILSYRLNFYIPIELVTDSMQRAQKPDAVTQECIWFRRRDWASGGLHLPPYTFPGDLNSSSTQPSDSTCALMSIDEIINGEHSTSSSRFPGLLAIVRFYLLEKAPANSIELATLTGYLDLISGRANGRLPTPARWMRDFVASHAKYQGDSVVSQTICYDMLRAVSEMNSDD